MSKSKKTTTRTPRAALRIAVICDRVLETEDGSFSIINIRDKLIVLTRPDQDPEKRRIPVKLNGFLAFVYGDLTGEHDVRVMVRREGRRRRHFLTQRVNFKGGNKGVTIRLIIKFMLKREGLLWFDVFVDKRWYTGMPLNVVFEPIAMPDAATS